MKQKKPSFFEICKKSQPELKEYCFEYLTKMNYKPIKEDGFVYAKGTVPVLLVAHLDTVHKALPKNIKFVAGKASDVNGIGGDDRCGVYMIMKIIRKLKCSVLFTEDEEIGCVGASKFCRTSYVKKLDVKYIIELDRKGKNDAVFYSCDNPEFTKFCTVKEIGFKEAFGSFTDICNICESSGIAGVNFSCGYENAHTTSEYVDIPTMEENIKRVMKLIETPVEEPFKFIRAKYYGGYYGGYYGSYYGSYGGWNDYDGYGYENDNWWQRETRRESTRVYSGGSKKTRYGQVTMTFEYTDHAKGNYDIAVEHGDTEAECWRDFFKNHPNICFSDVFDWDVLE